MQGEFSKYKKLAGGDTNWNVGNAALLDLRVGNCGSSQATACTDWDDNNKPFIEINNVASIVKDFEHYGTRVRVLFHEAAHASGVSTNSRRASETIDHAILCRIGLADKCAQFVGDYNSITPGQQREVDAALSAAGISIEVLREVGQRYDKVRDSMKGKDGMEDLTNRRNYVSENIKMPFDSGYSPEDNLYDKVEAELDAAKPKPNKKGPIRRLIQRLRR